MNVDATIRRLKDGVATPEDYRDIVSELERGSANSFELIPAYIKYASNISTSSVLSCLRNAKDPYVVGEIISGMARRGYAPQELVASAIRIADGEPWDLQENARISALFSLPDLVPQRDEALPVLRRALRSSNPVVVDASLVAAQRYCGVPEDQIIWGAGDDVAIFAMPPVVRAWLGLDPEAPPTDS